MGSLKEWDPAHALPENPAGVVLVDSLYLRRHAPMHIAAWLEAGGRASYLLAHYLPLEDPTLAEDAKAAWYESARTWLSALQGIFCTGQRQTEAWRRHFPQLRCIHFLPPAIPDQRTTPFPPPPQGQSHPLRLVTVGSLSPSKGQHEILATLAELRDQAFRWDLVGSCGAHPQYVRQLKEQIRTDNLAGKIAFHGSLPTRECAGLLEQAHLCVSASRLESFGMANAEALARSVPLLAYEAGDLPLWIDCGPGSWIINPRDPSAWRGQLKQLVREPGTIRPPHTPPRLPARSWDETTDFLRQALREPGVTPSRKR
jgi:glycosyltransferase involved in cell wall biosynthesis